MAFTTFRTWVPLEVVTAAMLNEQVRDNGNVLKTYIDNDGSHRTLVKGFAFSSGQGNAGGGADTQLTSYDVTIGADFMSQPGDALEFIGTWTLANTANTKTCKFKIGGGTLVTLFTDTSAVANLIGVMRFLIVRRTSSSAALTGFVTIGAANTAVTSHRVINASPGTVDWTASQTLAIYAAGTTANDLRLTDYVVNSLRGLNGATV